MTGPIRRIPILWLLAVAAVGIAAYVSTAGCYFLKDDLALSLLSDGANVTTWKGSVSWDAFVRNILWPTGQGHDQFWRPLPVYFAWLDLLVAGPDPAYFRIANIGFHALNGVLLAVFIHRLLKGQHALGSCVAAALWSLHPVHGEAVIWITQRMVVMSTTGTLLCLLGYQCWLTDRRLSGLSMAILGSLMALLSKETAASIPVMTAALAWCYPGTRPSRIRSAIIGGLTFAFVPVAVMGMRYLLFGTFSGTYAQLSPYEYMKKFEVIERLPQSLFNSFVGANRSEVTGLYWRLAVSVLVTMIIIGLGAALYSMVTKPRSLNLTLVGLSIAVASFLPTLPIFWVTEELTNGRFVYQPLTGFFVFVAAGLSTKSSRLVLVVLLAALPIAVTTGYLNRRAYAGADTQERSVISGLTELATIDGRDPIIIAYNIPVEHHGVATLDLSVVLALKPPFTVPGIRMIPLIEGQDRSWPMQLHGQLTALREALPDSPVVHARVTRNPWAVVPLYGPGEPPDGRPPEVLAPEDGAALTCPGPAPSFVFTAVPKAATYVIHLEVPGRKVDFKLRPGIDVKRFGTSFRWTFSDGDEGRSPNPWALLSQGTFDAPMAVSWRVEALSDQGQRLGISATRRIVILQA